MQIIYLVYQEANLYGIFKDKKIATECYNCYCSNGYMREVITDINIEEFQKNDTLENLFREESRNDKK